jgi:hypothetical protein
MSNVTRVATPIATPAARMAVNNYITRPRVIDLLVAVIVQDFLHLIATHPLVAFRECVSMAVIRVRGGTEFLNTAKSVVLKPPIGIFLGQVRTPGPTICG